MSDLETRTKKPGRHINRLVIVGFCLALTLLILLGVVFIPWDMPMPKVPDLEPDPTPPAMPAAENAFTYFEAAGKMQVQKFTAVDGGQRIWLDLLYERKPDGTPGWDPVFADEVLTANAATFAELEKGLACPTYQQPACTKNSSIYWLQFYKNLTILMNLKAKRAQLSGNYAEAVTTDLQGLRFGLLTARNSNTLIEWLMGIALQHISLAQLEIFAADSKMPEPVLRDMLNALNQLNPQDTVDGFREAMRGSYHLARQDDLKAEIRHWQKNGFSMFSEAPAVYRFVGIPYACKPNMTLAMTADSYRAVIANADRPYAKVNLDFPGKPIVPATTWDKIVFYAKPNSIGNVWFIQCMFLDKTLAKKCQRQAYVAGLRLKLALRLYELKHGDLPETLNALVPEYLPGIPNDPYDGQPFRYSKSGKKVWAVGLDLTDDGGMKKEANAIMIYRGRGTDAVMQLDPRDPNPMPAAIPPPATTH
jgi:hypothetical protein